MKLWPSVMYPRSVLLPQRNAGRLHWEKAESIQLCGFRVGQATTGAETQFWLRQPWHNLPLFFPHPPSDFSPSPFQRGSGQGISPWENCGIKDVCRYVLEHFGGLMRLIIFPWNKKVKFPAPFPYFLSPEDLRDAFRVAGDAFGRPWLQWIRRLPLTRHTQDFTMEGVH